jgi:hypothetical protein
MHRTSRLKQGFARNVCRRPSKVWGRVASSCGSPALSPLTRIVRQASSSIYRRKTTKVGSSFVPGEQLPDLNFLVITSSPPLPSMSILVNNLNETRDVYTFIRDVRAAYKLLVRRSFPCFILGADQSPSLIPQKISFDESSR